jgi:hypothetical protein
MTKTTATNERPVQSAVVLQSVDMLEPNRDWTGDPAAIGREDRSSETGGPELALDLGDQMQELLVAVAKAEANWRFDDLLDVATRQRHARERHRRWRPLR